jgi:LacI family transcriptional regulator
MVTMADVARTAGVSITTVSHVLNDTRAVSPETRARVERAITETGYRRNALARSLARRESATIGVAISSLTNIYFGPLVAAMNTGFEAAGYTVLLGDTGDDPAGERAVLERMLDHQVAGVVLAPASGSVEGVRSLQRAGTPVVLVDRNVDAEVDQVTPLNRRPVHDLTAHLADRGLGRVAAVTGRTGLDTTDERLLGFSDAVREYGLDDDPGLVVGGDSATDRAAAVVHDLFAVRRRPEGVVVMNNAMTIGAVRALHGLGLRVGEDVALVCYDDFDWADIFSPRLTAMRQEVGTMADRVVELLLARLADPAAPAVREQIAPTLQHRDSCGCSGARGDTASA